MSIDREELIQLLFSTRNTWESISDAQKWLNIRPIDGNWAYSGVLPTLFSGFNPFRGRVQIALNSHFGRIVNPELCPSEAMPPAADLKRLAREVLFAFHDFVHCCVVSICCDWVSRNCAFVNYSAKVQRKVIYHILALSEVSATVGLDFWRLTRRGIGSPQLAGHPFTGLTTNFQRSEADKELLAFVDSDEFFYEILGLFKQPGVNNCRFSFDWYERESRQARQFHKLMTEWIDFRMMTAGDVEANLENELSDLLNELTATILSLTKRFSYDEPEALLSIEPLNHDADILGELRPDYFNPRFQSISTSELNISNKLWEVLVSLPQRHYAYFVGQVHSNHWYRFKENDYRFEFDRLILERDRAGLQRFIESSSQIKIPTQAHCDSGNSFVFPS